MIEDFVVRREAHGCPVLAVAEDSGYGDQLKVV
jgi:hypothetical protein